MDGAVEYLRGVLPGAADLKELEEELAEKAPACQMEQVSSDNEQHYVTFLIHQSCKEQAMAIIKQRGFAQAPQEGEGTPAQYIGALEKQMAQMEQQRQDLIGKIKECGDAYRAMEQALDAYSMEAEEDQLLSGLVRTKNTVVITGWLPKKAEARVEKVLEREGCAYSMEDPQEGEDPPTAMENGPLAEPFNAITEMYGMPRYGSLIDPNPLMVPFYITFFAFIMGDAVYGMFPGTQAAQAQRNHASDAHAVLLLRTGHHCGRCADGRLAGRRSARLHRRGIGQAGGTACAVV